MAVGVVVGRRWVGCIGFGQTVARRGAHGRNTARMRIIKGRCKGALLLRQKSSRRILILAVLHPASAHARKKQRGEANQHGTYFRSRKILQAVVVLVGGIVCAVCVVRARPLVGHGVARSGAIRQKDATGKKIRKGVSGENRKTRSS